MKRVLTLALAGMLGVATLGYSQEIPDGVKEYMDQLQNDPTVKYGFDFAKKYRFIDSDVQFCDWFVGAPIEFFKLNGEALEKSDENSEIIELIVSTNMWHIPIRINGHYQYHVKVFFKNDKFEVGGCGEDVVGFHVWDKVRDKYPEESGVCPVVIDLKHRFIYFPNKKDGKSLFHVRNPKWDDDIYTITSKSIDNLDSNVKIIQYWKNDWLKNKEKRRKFLKKHPDLFKDNSGGVR